MKILTPSPLIAMLIVLASFGLLNPGPVRADRPQITRDQAEALVAGLHFQQGNIVLGDGLATLHVPSGCRFLDGADANTVLVKLWGNPPQPNPLGMLMPTTAGPLDEGGWAVVITYESDGYVKDAGAEKINYTELLTQMQSGVESGNAEREKAGYPAMHLVGWARAPRYDRPTHKLYWAKEIKFGQSPENILNYNIRMLGRGGVLVLNAIATMGQLSEIEKATPGILAAVEFNPGHRYADFNPGSDKVATYGLAALVAGGVAAKLGLFKGLWIGILAAKKFIIIGVAAVAAWMRKLFKGKAPTQEPGSEPTKG
ncbi:MAG TPA: DUF2167 domain-containing protein [Chthoniobacterales bacterium]|jgi:uncharacterized membrane-anchored protein